MPEQKYVRIKSSKDKMKITTPVASKEGRNKGRVILKKVVVGEAPKIKEASCSLGSSSKNLVYTIGITNPRPSTAWEATIVGNPKGILKIVKKVNKLTASTVSGMIRVP